MKNPRRPLTKKTLGIRAEANRALLGKMAVAFSGHTGPIVALKGTKISEEQVRAFVKQPGAFQRAFVHLGLQEQLNLAEYLQAGDNFNQMLARMVIFRGIVRALGGKVSGD